MAYTNDILGCIEQVRDIANVGNSPAQSAVVPRTGYGLLKHLRDILDPASAADAVYPDSIYGLLTQIRDSLNVGNSPAFRAVYTNDLRGLSEQIRDLLNRADVSLANYTSDALGIWRAIRDIVITQGFGVGVSTPAPEPPDDPLPPGEDIPDDPGNFDLGPFTVDVDGSVRLGGKKKNNGSVAKFLHDITAELALEANRVYTMLYDPDWSGMTQTGSLTMVGFVFKHSNDFYLSGLRGDGSTGVHGYQITGDGLWNATAGFVVSDEGAATHGTRDGPNWIQLETSADGTEITIRTSADGETWADEFTDEPAPFGNVSEVTQWGPGAFFNSEDSGTYQIDVSVWASADARKALDGLGATGAFSVSRDLLTSFIGGTRYTLNTGKIDLITDQTGNSRHLSQVSASERPIITTAGSNSRDAISFDGSDDYIRSNGTAISNFITNSSGYIICSVVIDAVDTNNGSITDNDGLWIDGGSFCGVLAKNNAGAHTVLGYNWDGNADVPTAHSVTTGSVLVVEWKHTGGNVSIRVNGGTWNSAASGNTSTITGLLNLGAKVTGTPRHIDCRIIDFATFNAALTTQQEDDLVADFLAWAGS